MIKRKQTELKGLNRKNMAGKKRRRRRGRRRQRQNRRSLQLFLLAVVGVVLCIGAVQLFLGNYVKKQNDGTIINGVSIGTTDVSGMTKKEATEAVKATLAGYGNVKVTFELESGGTFEATLAEMGLHAPELESTVEQATKYGYSGNAVSAYKTLKKAEKGKLDHTFPLKYEVAEKETGAILDERSSSLLAQPQNAYVTQQDGSVTVVKEKQGELPDHSAIVKSVNHWLNNDWDGKDGTLPASVKKTDPEITEEDLRDVTDLLGTYTTFYGSDGSGRAKNIETGASHIGGTLLAPGEEMSANAAMEPYTHENGYAEAASYESNTVVQTMGGGICQVSTTLYNAILFAELEIVERYPHSMLVGYVEPSMDAAIADDVLDLVFKNNQKTPIYIESVLAGGNLTFNIYGKETRNPGRTLEFVSETTESKETEGKRFVATEDYIGYIGVQSAAHPEISARLWKVVYENGAEVSRDVINYSTYIAAPETYGVGTVSDDPAAVEKINQAILTQDEAQIQAAIHEILYGVPAQETPAAENPENPGNVENAENAVQEGDAVPVQ